MPISCSVAGALREARMPFRLSADAIRSRHSSHAVMFGRPRAASLELRGDVAGLELRR
jgi:hypothetical protein